MNTTCKEECTIKRLFLDHEEPICFVTSQWQNQPKPSTLYLIYRWIIAVAFLITIILSIACLSDPEPFTCSRKWIIYLTDWGYTVCTFQACFAAFLLSICILAPNRQTWFLSKFYKLYWITNVVATDAAFTITALYWSLIYDAETMPVNANNLFLHVLNSVLMLIDLMVVSHPVWLLHFYYSLLFGVLYILFSVIYYLAGGLSGTGQVYIYNILDWRAPEETTLICVGALGLIMVLHVVVWGLFKFRMWIFLKCNREVEKI